MSAHGPGEPGASPPIDDNVHETVGAYALGLLEPAEESAFEEHLAGCERCAEQLEELIGLGPVLAALGDSPDSGPAMPDTAPATPDAGLATPDAPAPVLPGAPGVPRPPASAEPSGRRRPPVEPSHRLADRLMVEVATDRVRRRRRARFMVAAAAALIVAGPLAALGLSGADDTAQPPPSDSVALRNMPEKVQATDADTKVSATLGLANTPWGTDTVMELKNVKGPQACSLAAVGDDGSRQTMTSWTVPYFGYGDPDSKVPAGKLPLYVHGTAAFDLNDIDHFEVQTLAGKHLVTVSAPHTP